MKDLRYRVMRERLETLNAEQLRSIVDNIGIVLFDTHNYHDGKFCPMAVGLGCHKLEGKITEARVQSRIAESYLPINILKGVSGEFYHGSDDERKADLLLLCKQILDERRN